MDELTSPLNFPESTPATVKFESGKSVPDHFLLISKYTGADWVPDLSLVVAMGVKTLKVSPD